jgi:hypothetical protein
VRRPAGPPEIRPDVVALAKALRRKTKAGVRSLRQISAELAARGHLNREGKPFSASSLAKMLDVPASALKERSEAEVGGDASDIATSCIASLRLPFAGKLLRFGDLRGRHLHGYKIPTFHRVFVPTSRRQSCLGWRGQAQDMRRSTSPRPSRSAGRRSIGCWARRRADEGPPFVKARRVALASLAIYIHNSL